MSDLPDRIRDVVIALEELTDEERMEVFCEFCTYCGRVQPDDYRCQCWNDE